MFRTRPIVISALLYVLSYSGAAAALELKSTPPAPTLLGQSTTLTIELSGAVGEAQIRWTYGDGTESEFAAGATTVEHTYDAPGHYTITALVQDSEGYQSTSYVHAVHRPLTPERAQTSSEMLLDEERGLIVTANLNNGTVSLVDVATLENVGEIPVFSDPVALALAPDGLLWVVDRENYAVAIVDLDERKAVDFFRLPYASQPVGIVFSPSGDAYIPLFATGDVVQIDSTTHEIVQQNHVGPFARGITISGDGASLWVTRFISQGDHAEVYRLDPETLEVIAQSDLIEDTTTEDSDVQGRGLPNYLFSISVNPDGTSAWIPSKKDNMSRGLMRDGQATTQDTAVRPLVSILDLSTDEEMYERRIDLDDRNLPRHVTFNTTGDWAFISVYGSNLVELRDAFTGSFITALRPDGLMGPSTSLLDAEGRLFVLASLSRELFVFDVADLMNGVDQSTQLLTTVPLVANEKLDPVVLRGHQVFANAEDGRMAKEGYQSCDTCHFEGYEDGQVWDFFERGEGFRNTISLLGRRGTGHGRVHWSANFDEIQDFENPIRAFQGGGGFIPLDQFEMGTVSDSLGDPKAGLNEDLDALAAYVTSLDKIPRSPFRNSDGSLTEAAVAGEQIFTDLGCDSCHSGDDYTNSIDGVAYDVGTMTELSGGRLGGDLLGLDTPTLLGIWQTAPYLHDGSAETLLDVLTTRNQDDLHGVTSTLSELELQQLVAYLEQVDQGLPVEELTLPPPGTGNNGTGGEAQGGAAGTGGVNADGSGGSSSDGAGGSIVEGAGGTDPGTGNNSGKKSRKSGCSYEAGSSEPNSPLRSLSLLSFLGLGVVLRLRASKRSALG